MATEVVGTMAVSNLVRQVRELSSPLFSLIFAAVGGVVGVAIMIATSGAVPWYWGLVGVVVTAFLWRFIEMGRELRAFQARQDPKLEIVFVDGQRPYVDERTVWRTVRGNDEPFEERRYRVGIQNLGDQPIVGARVVLERCDPAEGDMLFPGHPLAVMGNDCRDGVFTVHPSDTPTAFVDVVHDSSATGEPHSDWILICYANPDLPSMLPPASIRFTLRVEGGGAYARKMFIVEKLVQTRRRLEMREIEGEVPSRVIA